MQEANGPASGPPGGGRRDAEAAVDIATVYQPAYLGRAGDLGRIAVGNAVLQLATLGIYRFWARTRLRRYLWSRLAFVDDRFEYAGTARELLIGFLVVMAIIIPLLLIGGWLELELAARPDALHIYQLVQGLLILFLIQVALYRARRYRLTRTRWRGVAFGQDGSALAYAGRAMLWYLALAATLGLAYPAMAVDLQRYRTANTSFGDRAFVFSGRAGTLFGRWLLAWLLLLPTLGISYVWYRVHQFRVFCASTRFGAFGFRSDLRAGPVLLIYLRYLFVFVVLAVVLLVAVWLVWLLAVGPGFGASAASQAEAAFSNPALWIGLLVAIGLFLTANSILHLLLVVHPLLIRITGSLTVTGPVDAIEELEREVRAARERPRYGEGLADALDVGAI